MTNLAIILPAYNEKLTIAATIEAFYREAPEAQIVVINNNSKDETGTIARETLKRLHANGVVIDEYRQGKGNAIRRAFTEIDADIYLMSDADLTYPASRLHDLIRPLIENKADMVVGDRHSKGDYKQENKRPMHAFGNNLVKWLVNRLFKASLADIMSGYRAFNRKFVQNYPIMVEGFELETDVTLHALDKRFRIVEIPVEYLDRPEGSESKLNTISDGAKVIFTIVQILRHYRPLAFFSLIALFFCLLGICFSIPVFYDWFTYKEVFRLPSAVLAASLELVSVMALAVGLILDSIAQLNKMQFEKGLLRGNSSTLDEKEP